MLRWAPISNPIQFIVPPSWTWSLYFGLSWSLYLRWIDMCLPVKVLFYSNTVITGTFLYFFLLLAWRKAKYVYRRNQNPNTLSSTHHCLKSQSAKEREGQTKACCCLSLSYLALFLSPRTLSATFKKGKAGRESLLFTQQLQYQNWNTCSSPLASPFSGFSLLLISSPTSDLNKNPELTAPLPIPTALIPSYAVKRSISSTIAPQLTKSYVCAQQTHTKSAPPLHPNLTTSLWCSNTFIETRNPITITMHSTTNTKYPYSLYKHKLIFTVLILKNFTCVYVYLWVYATCAWAPVQSILAPDQH